MAVMEHGEHSGLNLAFVYPFSGQVVFGIAGTGFLDISSAANLFIIDDSLNVHEMLPDYWAPHPTCPNWSADDKVGWRSSFRCDDCLKEIFQTFWAFNHHLDPQRS